MPAYKGLWISTPFPAFGVAAGQSITLDMTVHNAGLPPQRVELAVQNAPEGWTASFLGDGKRISSAFVAPDGQADVKLRIEPPSDVTKGTYHFDITATGTDSSFTLPVDLSVGDLLPPKLTLEPELPVLRGSPTSSFKFNLKLRNEGGGDALVQLEAAAPPGFQVRFTEQYGSQELTSLPVKAGEQKSISASVDLPQSVEAGTYPISVRASTADTSAETRLTMEVTGQPKLTLAGQSERLSADAYAGKETPIDIVLTNSGTAEARKVKLSASEPSGWKVSFEPDSFDSIKPGETQTVKANVTPSERAIAGDYMLTVRASGEGVSTSADFRTTVLTSTLWGIVGVLIIAAALVVLILAVLRYGRR
ncbi:MAG: ABC transporter substrate-binding protein [Rhodospirillaceae bacterium]|nr:ABC transporter substrate-binding protein [Rhodospirillaceae bacterium]